MGWYASSSGKVIETEDYPPSPFWARLPDPEALRRGTGAGRFLTPGSDDRMVVAVPGPFGVVGVPVRLINGAWERAGEVRPLAEFYDRAREDRGEVVHQWHRDGRITHQDVIGFPGEDGG